jgi:tetratricopeptide (TPR) repeat protein
LPVILLKVLPIALAFGVLTNRSLPNPALYFIVYWGLFAFGLLVSETVLTHAYTRFNCGNQYIWALRRFLPWIALWAIIVPMTILGLLFLVVPGIVVFARLFWAKEFALTQSCSPLAALQRSWNLTQGQTGRIISFMLFLWMAEYAVVFASFVLTITFVRWGAILPLPLSITDVLGFALIFTGVIAVYASFHAPLLVYFYSIRLQAEEKESRLKTLALGVCAAAVLVAALAFVGRLQPVLEAEGQTEYEPPISDQQKQAAIPSGIVVTAVPYFTYANAVGLKTGDVITEYNHDRIYDRIGYYDAIAKNRQHFFVHLKLVRDGVPKEIGVLPRPLGFWTWNWTFLRDHIGDLIQANQISEAEKALAEAESAGNLSQSDVLVSKIMFIPDDAISRDPERFELLRKLWGVTPNDELNRIGHRLYDMHRYKAAATVWEHATKIYPHWYWGRLNLGSAYAFSGRFDQAEKIANSFIQERDQRLSAGEWAIVYRIKGLALDGKGDFKGGLAAHVSALQKNPDPDETHLIFGVLLSAASLKNIPEFERAVKLCEARAGQQYRSRLYYTDALKAYVLAANNRVDEARLVAQKWANNPNAISKVVSYFSAFQNGAAVVENWNRLIGRERASPN